MTRICLHGLGQIPERLAEALWDFYRMIPNP